MWVLENITFKGGQGDSPKDAILSVPLSVTRLLNPILFHM